MAGPAGQGNVNVNIEDVSNTRCDNLFTSKLGQGK